MKTLSITAKCSDMFSAHLRDEKGAMVGGAYDGYVPDWFPNNKEEHYGDYVQLRIDVATGKILNWKAPTQAELDKTFAPSEQEL